MLLFAATLFGFDGIPAKITATVAGVHLILTAFTAIPLGVIKLIPFKVHGAIEVLVGLVLIVLPWVIGFAQVNAARNVFLGLGIVILMVAMLTDFPGSGAGGGTAT